MYVQYNTLYNTYILEYFPVSLKTQAEKPFAPSCPRVTLCMYNTKLPDRA